MCIRDRFLGCGDGLDLGGDHRECWQGDSVELIEASPETTLAHTFEDLGHVSVFMLIRAVGYDDENTEGTSQILHSLCLARTGWSCWSTTIHHTKSLSECDIASISEWSDAKSLLHTEELIGVGEVDISDGNNDVLLFVSVETSGVLGPLEGVGIFDLVVLYEISDDSEQPVSYTHLTLPTILRV